MTGTRVLTALVLVPLVVAAVWFAPPSLVTLLVAASAAFCLQEYLRVCAKAGHSAYVGATWFCGAAIVYAQWARRSNAWLYESGSWQSNPFSPPIEFVFFVCLLALSGQGLLSRSGVRRTLTDFSISAAGLLLIVLPISYLIRIRGVQPENRKILLFTLCVVWVGDSVAYFVGRAFGKHLLAPQISPKKTWEGAIGNLLGSAAVGYVFGRFIIEFYVWHFVAIAVLASIAGQLGDLVESACKRSADVKDSGAILPGHGGLWDRLDALIFAAPVVWWYVVSVDMVTRYLR